MASTEPKRAFSRAAVDGHRPAGTWRTRSAAEPSELDLAVIVPTRDEGANIGRLLERLHATLGQLATEIIFVDDSDDDTPKVIQALGSEFGAGNWEVAMIHRPRSARRGGLGGAVVEGLRAARAPWVCVMDADLQHPPEVVPRLLDQAEATGASLVVASRYRADGATGSFTGTRTMLSRGATTAARTLFPQRLRGITDPMSGFFLVRREAVEPDALRPQGFKILLEIAVRTPGLRVAEVGFRFGDRYAGRSKASTREGLAYLQHLGKARFELARHAPRSRVRSAAARTHCYDIHGIITVESDARLPELEHFRVQSLADPTIRVRLGEMPPESPSDRRDLRHLRYTERFGTKGFGADIRIGEKVEITATPMLRRSPHVLYTNLVEPVLRWSFVERGYALVHGACIVEGDTAYMITARTDTGKTTTMLKLLDARPYDFVADDLTIVRPDGTVLPYPKPLTISAHTLSSVKTPLLTRRERSTLGLQSRLHSRSGRKFAFLLTSTGLPVATVNAVVQFLVPPPKYPVQRLVPRVKIAGDARLSALFVIQRADDGFEWLAEDDALEILLANCEDAYGFPPYHAIEEFLFTASGNDLREIERQIIAGALEGRPAALMSSTSLGWAEQIPGVIDDLQGLADVVPMASPSWTEPTQQPVPDLTYAADEESNGAVRALADPLADA